jgi:hypothetical protein
MTMAWQIAQLGLSGLQNFDWQSAYENAIGLRKRAAQHSAAHVVSALNAVVPADRAPWTPESLGSFIAAFADIVRERATGSDAAVVVLREPTEIIALILRGTDAEGNQRSGLETMLQEECDEVFDTLRHVHKYVRDNEQAVRAQPKDLQGKRIWGITALTALPLGPIVALGVVRAAQATGGLVSSAGSKISAQKRALLERQIAAIHAKALLDGGLSTHECREVLKLHHLSDRLIDDALTAGPSNE